MLKMSIFLSAMVVLTASARPAASERSLETQPSTRVSKPSSQLFGEPKPNEIVKGNVTYSGIVVQLLKTGKPLQLINPAAPAKYGSGEDNVLWNPTSGKVSGWKLFSIGF